MTDKEKIICEKYSARYEDGFVHCNDCPLVIDREEHLCKANLDNVKWEVQDEHDTETD